MDAFKNRGDYLARNYSFFRSYDLDIFRSDDDVDFRIDLEIVYAVEDFIDEADFSVADDRAVIDVALADKVGNESVCRFVVDVLRSADLLDFAVLHYDDPVAHREGFLLVVSYVDKCYSEFSLHVFELKLHVLSHFEVESSKRLVEKEDLWLVDDSACYCDSLLLTARKGSDFSFFEVFKVDHLQSFAHFFVYLCFCECFLEFKPERDVVVDIEVGEKGVTLENRVDRTQIWRKVGDILAVKQDLSSSRDLKTCDHSQCRRFAAARWAKKRYEFSAVHVKIEVGDSQSAAVELFRNSDELNNFVTHNFSSTKNVSKAKIPP